MRKLSLLFILILIGTGLNAQPLSGNYYIPQGGNPQGFITLEAAITSLNTNGLSGPTTFFIDNNLTENGTNCVINRADMTSTNFLTIKPAPGKTPTVTFSANATTKEFFTLDGADYVVIDGSNTPGGTTRDMSFIFDDAVNGRWAVQVKNHCTNVTIKNLKVIPVNLVGGTLNTAGIPCDGNISPGSGQIVNILIENCQVGTPQKSFETGIAMWGNTPETPTIGTIRNCDIYSGRRTISTFYNAKNVYENNNLYISEPRSNRIFYTHLYITGSVTGDTTIIRNNKFMKITANNTSNAFAAAVTVYGNTGVINFYNNFIAPEFENLGAAAGNRYYGIVFGSATWNGVMNIAYNTIRLAPSSTTGRQAILGTEVNSNATLNLMNNIFSNEQNTEVSFIYHWPNTPGATSMLNSDNNNYTLGGSNAKMGVYGPTTYNTLSDWITGSSQDLNSMVKAVNFVSASDLHLAGSSVGDFDLKAIPIEQITTDIDGDMRSPVFPYKGADEASVPLPVELVSFSASIIGAGVELSWSTASELNNSGFDVQRSTDGVNFTSLGFVRGNGTTTSTSNYTFVDEMLRNAYYPVVYYRLKQVDYTGEFTYSSVIEIDMNGVIDFALNQNYPNPFNPSTTIAFSLLLDATVSLIVYDISGSEVSSVVNGQLKAGKHQIIFDATNLSSGNYFYKLTAVSADGKSFSETKKMALLK